MNDSKLEKNKKQNRGRGKKRLYPGRLIRWFKEDMGLKLSCIVIAAFVVIVCVVMYFFDKEIEEKSVPVNDYRIEEMNQILSTADEIQYACYSFYWNRSFTVLVDEKGIGTLTIPIFDSVNIANQAEEVLCMQEETEVEFEEARGLTYVLINQGKTTGYLVENNDHGFFFDTEKKLAAIYNSPEWEEDEQGIQLADPEGNIVARLTCDPSLHTITISCFTDDFRLTPEQQMSMLYYYLLKRYNRYPEEFSVDAEEYPLFYLFD